MGGWVALPAVTAELTPKSLTEMIASCLAVRTSTTRGRKAVLAEHAVSDRGQREDLVLRLPVTLATRHQGASGVRDRALGEFNWLLQLRA